MPLFTDFPPDDLRDSLVELYFRTLNDDMPLLHEPSFKKAVESGLHLRDSGFGATVLLVCANGARSSSDPRILADTHEGEDRGWKWFKAVQTRRKVLLGPASLHDLQIYVVRSFLHMVHYGPHLRQLSQLLVLYLQSTNAPQAAWPLIGMGIRAAIDVGAHRKHMYSETPQVEEELWRRAFWCVGCVSSGSSIPLV